MSSYPWRNEVWLSRSTLPDNRSANGLTREALFLGTVRRENGLKAPLRRINLLLNAPTLQYLIDAPLPTVRGFYPNIFICINKDEVVPVCLSCLWFNFAKTILNRCQWKYSQKFPFDIFSHLKMVDVGTFNSKILTIIKVRWYLFVYLSVWLWFNHTNDWTDFNDILHKNGPYTWKWYSPNTFRYLFHFKMAIH